MSDDAAAEARRAREEAMAKAIKDKAENDRKVQQQRDDEERDKKLDDLVKDVKDGGYPIHPDLDGGGDGGNLPPGIREIAHRLMFEKEEMEAKLRRAELEKEYLLEQLVMGG